MNCEVYSQCEVYSVVAPAEAIFLFFCENPRRLGRSNYSAPLV